MSFPKHIKFVRQPIVDIDGNRVANCFSRKMFGVIGHNSEPTIPGTDRWNIVLDKLIEDLDEAVTHLYTYKETIMYDAPSPYILTNYVRYASIYSTTVIESKSDKYYDFMKMESW